MSSIQRSQPNNQSSNGGNEKFESSSRGGKDDKDNSTNNAFDADPAQQAQQSQQSNPTGNQQQGSPAERTSNDAAGGLPKRPGGKHLAADQNMDDDTGLSNRGNRQLADDIDEGTRQDQQSNVGRRSDGTPD